MSTPPEPRVEAPTRVRVTSSRHGAAAPRRAPLARDLSEQTGLGEVYLRGLMAAQLRLSVTVLAMGVVGLGGLPLLFRLVPETRSITVFGIGLSWLALGVAVYPVAVLVARYYVRQAERIEAEFREVMNQS
jgi:hypothetical protein